MPDFDLMSEIRKLAAAMAAQAQAVADGKYDDAPQLRGAAARLLGNAETLKAWAAVVDARSAR